jgi:hypothetical protein
MGLVDLIALHYDRAAKRWNQILMRSASAETLPQVQRLVGEVADPILETAQTGDYLGALQAAECAADFDLASREDWFERDGLVELYYPAIREALEECKPLLDVCNLAHRIDSFLASLSTNNTAAAFARGCRDDLTTLLILADWCDEQNLPHAAAEARHLHNLTRYLLR